MPLPTDPSVAVSLEFQIDSRETLRDALLDPTADDTFVLNGSIDGSVDLEVGASVQIRCVAREFTLFLDGVVLWRREAAEGGDAPVGTGIRIAPECGGRLAFLRSWALQPMDRLERVGERHPAATEAEIEVDGRTVKVKLVNVSDMGACAVVPEPLVAEQAVTLRLGGPVTGSWAARVAWARGTEGGLSLRFDNLEGVQAWQAVVAAARSAAPPGQGLRRIAVKHSGNVPFALRLCARAGSARGVALPARGGTLTAHAPVRPSARS